MYGQVPQPYTAFLIPPACHVTAGELAGSARLRRFDHGSCHDNSCSEVASEAACRGAQESESFGSSFSSGTFLSTGAGGRPDHCYYKVSSDEVTWNQRTSHAPGSAQREKVCSCTQVAVGETSVILLHPPLHVAGVPIGTERERQQNDSPLADGYTQGTCCTTQLCQCENVDCEIDTNHPYAWVGECATACVSKRF